MENDRKFWFEAISPRGWVGAALFILTLVILGLCAWNPENLRDDKMFQVIAQAIVMTGFIAGVIGYYFVSSKSSTEMRDQIGKALDLVPTQSKSEVISTITTGSTTTPTPEPSNEGEDDVREGK